jgi:hypothetical protein
MLFMTISIEVSLMSNMKDIFYDYMYAEATVDAISELHRKVTQIDPEYLRDGFCEECSHPDLDLYVMFPCETQRILRNK